MPVKPIEQVPSYRAINPEISVLPERRKRRRVQVHWPIWFHDTVGTTDTVETVTSDLSSDGFYCLTRTPFGSGELRVCTLGVPTDHPWSAERLLLVKCKIWVVRVQSHGEGLFGIGCRIQDYRFADSPAVTPVRMAQRPETENGWRDVAGRDRLYP